jgi:hypothetical protein
LISSSVFWASLRTVGGKSFFSGFDDDPGIGIEQTVVPASTLFLSPGAGDDAIDRYPFDLLLRVLNLQKRIAKFNIMIGIREAKQRIPSARDPRQAANFIALSFRFRI